MADVPDGPESPASGPLVPGGQFAAQIRQLDQATLRMRYRGGVVINAHGIPEWDLLARALVELPDPEPGLTIDEMRVLDVLSANEFMVDSGDPMWSFTSNDYVALTPPGWTWAHVALSRRLALVPTEVYGAFRHIGGAALMKVPRDRRGVRLDDPTPVPMDFHESLADELLDKLERHLGYSLPEAYRTFLARTNGGEPTTPGIHPSHGFVVDQPFFGLAREDRTQDLSYLSLAFDDILTTDFLPIGYVQGGLLAVRVAGADTGSVWYYDADDYRAEDGQDPEYIADHLLYRCGDDFDAFRQALAVAPRRLLDIVDANVKAGRIRALRPPELGASLPASRRDPAGAAGTAATARQRPIHPPRRVDPG